MSPIEEFESTLKEVVQAKRLSASKMTKLTELAMKLMKDDTKLVSILYRTHKSLSAAAKVSSLYIFDALARAAKHQVNKQNLFGDINAPEGNCATFLLKLQGILDGLFKDMVLSGTPEAKEKTKKVLDIWVKGNTFPSTMLSQLADVLKDTVKESTAKAVVSSDPRIAAAQSSASANTPTPPPTSTTPPFPPTSLSSTHIPALSTPLDPQSKILALLTQAINVGAASTSNQASSSAGPAPIPSAGPQLDVAQAQLALLQQLTQTAHNH
ncbi:rna maturation rna-binding [Lentinula edodes]|uniref:Rna maturation rna-binding n=1 Tax=Lentinula edodes TaxID=5353 RepID=A0A1Q3DZP7_LENED|nr:rna maturation rna-binding [Lentinula edodes]